MSWAISAVLLCGCLALTAGGQRPQVSFYVEETISAFVAGFNLVHKPRTDPPDLPDFETAEFKLRGVRLGGFQNWTVDRGRRIAVSGPGLNNMTLRFYVTVGLDLRVGDLETATFSGVPLLVSLEGLSAWVAFRVTDFLETSCDTALEVFHASDVDGFMFYFKHDSLQVGNAASYLGSRFLDYINTNVVNPSKGDFFNSRFKSFVCERN